MFHDPPGKKILKLFLPAIIYILAGGAAELIGVGVLKLVSGEDLTFSQYLYMLHVLFPVALLLGRCVLTLPFLIVIFNKDSKRIPEELYIQTSLKERPEFFTEKLTGNRAAAVICAVILTGIGFSVFVNLLFQLLGWGDAQSAVTASAEALAKVPLRYAGVLVLNLLIAPCTEELMHRGITYRIARTYMLRLFSLLISAGLFALLHGSIKQGVYAFLLGLVLGNVYEWTGCLIFPVILHIAANGTSLLLSLNAALNSFALGHKPVMMIVGGAVLAAGFLLVLLTASGKLFSGERNQKP